MLKMFRSNFFRIVAFALFIFLLIYYTFVYINTVRIEEVISETENALYYYQSEIDTLNAAIDSGEAEAYDAVIKESLEMQLTLSEETLKEFKEGNWDVSFRKRNSISRERL